MTKSADYTQSFLELLIAASPESDFIRKKHRTRGVCPQQQAAIEKIFCPLESSFRAAVPTYPGDAYAFNLTVAYLRRILRNERVAGYLKSVHRRLFEGLLAEGIPHVDPHVRQPKRKKMADGLRASNGQFRVQSEN
jgi:hypothetical protein